MERKTFMRRRRSIEVKAWGCLPPKLGIYGKEICQRPTQSGTRMYVTVRFQVGLAGPNDNRCDQAQMKQLFQ